MTIPDTILISPVGDIPETVSRRVAQDVEMIFGFKTRIHPLLADIDFAYDVGRNQYYSTKILEALEAVSPDDSIKVLAITREDLFIPILTHVYGEAQLGGRTSIVSISRLSAGPESGGPETSMDRIIKEAVHELGHTFDLRHCDDALCIMHYCRKIEDVDHKMNRFCRYCTIFLSDHIKTISETGDRKPETG